MKMLKKGRDTGSADFIMSVDNDIETDVEPAGTFVP